jgi:antitoxin component of RelBE/YafQ-DinJ toxin-antitoxin module
MTSQVLFRTDSELKKAFQARTKAQGLSMDYVLNMFVQTYINNPQIIETYIDEEAFDEMIRRSFDTPEAKKAMISLGETLKKKWLS